MHMQSKYILELFEKVTISLSRCINECIYEEKESNTFWREQIIYAFRV